MNCSLNTTKVQLNQVLTSPTLTLSTSLNTTKVQLNPSQANELESSTAL